ncbi:hypothetical protein [Neomoorella humiferrea]|uniref:hypothetical protein n=1 Tax=Neomoorella humiferrea TaxID=676965 RepID=UPI0030D4BCDB
MPKRSRENSRTTHGAMEAVDACRYMAADGSICKDLQLPHFGHSPGAGFMVTLGFFLIRENICISPLDFLM